MFGDNMTTSVAPARATAGQSAHLGRTHPLGKISRKPTIVATSKKVPMRAGTKSPGRAEGGSWQGDPAPPNKTTMPAAYLPIESNERATTTEPSPKHARV